MFDSLQKAPQYELSSFVTMAAYQVPDLPNIKGYSGHWPLAFHIDISSYA